MRRAAIVVLCASSVARADGSATVTLNQLGMQVANEIGASVADATANAQQKVDALFELSGLPHLLKSFANTGAFANRGLGVDYQMDQGDAIAGVVADGAIASDAGLTSDHPLSATLINYAVHGGVNLGRWRHPRWSVFANGAYAQTTIRGLAGALTSAGAHVEYQLVQPTAPSRARWTGLAVTTGLEYARWSIGLASSLETHIVVSGTKKDAYVHLSCTGTLSVLAETVTVPVEVTTGVRFFHVLGLYAGGGADFTAGSSTIDAVMDAVMSIDSDRKEIGTAHITASGASGPTTATVHALGGLELHVPHFRAFVQGAISSDERAVSLGLRAVF